jgi:hypothetical protein
MDDLRNHLFELIEMVKDDEIDLDKAKTITDAAKVLVDSAKAEVMFLRTMKADEGQASRFLNNKSLPEPSQKQ